ncbi:MAG: hypothetical protein ACI8S6_000527 [Myxococcota bacterium]|jgi:hypothetical protein
MRRYTGEISVAILIAMSIGLACISPPGLDTSQGHFPLQGEHATLSCSECHGESLTTLPTDCMSCHLADRPAEHTGDRLGDCAACHSELGWQYAVDDHSFLPLEDAHAILCSECHDDLDTFTGLAGSTCQTCHLDDTPGPDHFLGQECSNCHNTISWGDVDFDHDDFFPLPHEGVSDCTSCHVNNDSYQTFECIECHAHTKQKMDDEHRGETNNYVWESAACLDCHPKGRE